MDKYAMKKATEKVLKGLLKAVIIYIILNAIFAVFLFVLMCPKFYLYFSEERIAEMEEMFSIKVTDDIELKNYREVFGLQAGTSYILILETENDYEKFIEENVICKEIKGTTENDKAYAYSGDSAEKYVAWYTYDNMVSVTVAEKGDEYEIVLRNISHSR